MGLYEEVTKKAFRQSTIHTWGITYLVNDKVKQTSYRAKTAQEAIRLFMENEDKTAEIVRIEEGFVENALCYEDLNLWAEGFYDDIEEKLKKEML